MKTAVLFSALILVYSSSVFAGFGSVVIVQCTDDIGRTLILERVTGLTGGVPGTVLASVTVNDAAIGVPQPVIESQPDVTFPTQYTGGGIVAEISSVQFMDIPATQARGTLSLNGESAQMLCNKAPASISRLDFAGRLLTSVAVLTRGI